MRGVGASLAVGIGLAAACVPPPRMCVSEAECGTAAACVAGRCVARGATPAIDSARRLLFSPVDVGWAHRGGADASGGSPAVATLGRGVDKVLLTADRIVAELYPLAVECLAPGGVVVQVGTPDTSLDHIPVPPYALLRKQLAITGTVYGGMDTAADALRWLSLYRAGRLPLDRFVTRTYPLEDINRAFTDMAEGRNIRGVVVYD